MDDSKDPDTPCRLNIPTKTRCTMQSRFRQFTGGSDAARKCPLPDVVVKSSHNSNYADFIKRKAVLGSLDSLKSDLATNQENNLKDEYIKSSGIMDEKISPGLARLRMTPGALREKQRRLIDQHDVIRQKGDQLKTGGGVSLWPEMHQMRLTKSEVSWLSAQAIGLFVITLQLLNTMHYATFCDLQEFAGQIRQFCETHKISEGMNQTLFQNQVTHWHNRLLSLTDRIQNHFDITSMSTSYQLSIVMYILGLTILLYYLLDNILANNKLTPSRIKKWTCLLVVIGTWTGMMSYGLYCACLLEQQVTRCVQRYASALSLLVVAPLDLDLYQAVLLYWRSRFLDNASQGLLSVLGVIPVRDFVYYLQYYSVPIVTVIVSPVVKLCFSCLAVYRQGEYLKASSL